MPNEKIEQNKVIVEELEKDLKSCKENAQFNKAVEICEKLVFEYDYFGYRFELPELYNRANLYGKTIDFLNSWMAEAENSEILLLMTSPFLFLGDAYFKIGNTVKAIESYNIIISLEEEQIKKIPDRADINDKKLMIAIANTRIGEVYYKGNNFIEARKCFQSASQSAPYIVAICYIAHMCYYGQAFEKDIATAISIYEDIVDADFGMDEEFTNCVKKANYELGMIFATENGYKDKEKALLRLNKAKELGHKITDSEISSIIKNIVDDEPLNDNSCSAKRLPMVLNVLIIIFIAVGVISLFGGSPMLFWICILLLIIFIIIKKIVNKINKN